MSCMLLDNKAIDLQLTVLHADCVIQGGAWLLELPTKPKL